METLESKKNINKSYWNYRIIKTKDHKLRGIKQTYSYGIYIVHYEKCKPVSWSTNPVPLVAEDTRDLYLCYKMMEEAFKKPHLFIRKNKLIEYPHNKLLTFVSEHVK